LVERPPYLHPKADGSAQRSLDLRVYTKRAPSGSGVDSDSGDLRRSGRVRHISVGMEPPR